MAREINQIGDKFISKVAVWDTIGHKERLNRLTVEDILEGNIVIVSLYENILEGILILAKFPRTQQGPSCNAYSSTKTEL